MYNHEHYRDPTPAQALRQHRHYPRTYICSAYRGDTIGNAKRAAEYCRYAVANGRMPIAPHLFFPLFMDDSDPEQRSLALLFGKRLLAGCKELWVFGCVTEGMRGEIDAAVNHYAIPVRHFTKDMKGVSQHE